ncbi:MAG: FHA domain-containing protein [Bdellovibrionales bacterium]
MNATAPASIPQIVYVLKIISGPDKGSTYKLVSGKATLGRETGNDINLNDQRCSQKHLAVLIQGQKIFIKDMGSRNGVHINGRKIEETTIQPGEPVQIGDTVFVINKEAPLALPSLSVVPPVSSTPSSQLQSPYPSLSATNAYPRPLGIVPPPGMPRSSLPQTPPSSALQKFLREKPKLVVGIVLGALVLLLMSSGAKKKKADYGLRTEDQVNAEIADIEKKKTELARQKVNSAQFSEQGKEAQAAYLQGFRDYREGNYSRAIQSFTAALALLPDHSLAQQYKRLSERRLDELVQFNLLEGKRHMEQNKYELARSNYRNVQILINDTTNRTWQEAAGQLQVIDLILTGRY